MIHPLSLLPIVLGVVLYAAAPAAAQFAGPTLANPAPAAVGKKAPVADKPARACLEYGAGYVRLDNGTCVKIGGYVRFEGGANPR